MPTTAGLALPYPALSAAPNVPADVQALADRLEALYGPSGSSAAWAAFTPVLTGSGVNPNIGTTGTKTGRYKQVGKTVFWSMKFTTSGTGIAAGTGTYLYGLPVSAQASADCVGSAWIYNGTSFFPCSTSMSATQMVIVTSSGYQASTVAGFTGAGNVVSVGGTYEAA